MARLRTPSGAGGNSIAPSGTTGGGALNQSKAPLNSCAEPAAHSDAAVALFDEIHALDGLAPRHDVLAVAGPFYADRLALYDFVVAELNAENRGPKLTYNLDAPTPYFSGGIALWLSL